MTTLECRGRPDMLPNTRVTGRDLGFGDSSQNSLFSCSTINRRIYTVMSYLEMTTIIRINTTDFM